MVEDRDGSWIIDQIHDMSTEAGSEDRKHDRSHHPMVGSNRFLVVLMSIVLAVSGIYVMANTPVDAIPDLSDVQVIIKTPFPGQAPQVVEDQVTYPLTTAMLSVPGASTVRGYSFFRRFDDAPSLKMVLTCTGRDPERWST